MPVGSKWGVAGEDMASAMACSLGRPRASARLNAVFCEQVILTKPLFCGWGGPEGVLCVSMVALTPVALTVVLSDPSPKEFSWSTSISSSLSPRAPVRFVKPVRVLASSSLNAASVCPRSDRWSGDPTERQTLVAISCPAAESSLIVVFCTTADVFDAAGGASVPILLK